MRSLHRFVHLALHDARNLSNSAVTAKRCLSIHTFHPNPTSAPCPLSETIQSSNITPVLTPIRLDKPTLTLEKKKRTHQTQLGPARSKSSYRVITSLFPPSLRQHATHTSSRHVPESRENPRACPSPLMNLMRRTIALPQVGLCWTTNWPRIRVSMV